MSRAYNDIAAGITVVVAGVAVASQDAVFVGVDVNAVNLVGVASVASVASVALVAAIAGAPVAAGVVTIVLGVILALMARRRGGGADVGSGAVHDGRPIASSVIGAVAAAVAAVIVNVFFASFNSQGFTHHGYQLIAQVLIALAVVMALRATGWAFWVRVDLGDVVRAVIAGAYVAAGLTKLLASGGRFVLDADALAIDAVKTHLDHLADHGGIAVAHLDAAMASVPGAVSLLVTTPMLARVVFGLGLVMELGALLLCVRHPVQIAIAGGLIAMHRAIAGLMGLSFPMHELLLMVWGLWLPFMAHRRRQAPP